MMKKVDTFRSVEYVSLRMGWGQIRDKMTIHFVFQITVRLQLNRKREIFHGHISGCKQTDMEVIK